MAMSAFSSCPRSRTSACSLSFAARSRSSVLFAANVSASISSRKPEVEKLVGLPLDQRKLTVQFRPLFAGVVLLLAGPGPQHAQNPIPNLFILNPQLGEQGENLGVQVRLGKADAGMPLTAVLGASVVVVIAFPRLGLLGLPLPHDLVPTLARNQVAAVGQFMGPVNLPAQQALGPAPKSRGPQAGNACRGTIAPCAPLRRCRPGHARWRAGCFAGIGAWRPDRRCPSAASRSMSMSSVKAVVGE